MEGVFEGFFELCVRSDDISDIIGKSVYDMVRTTETKAKQGRLLRHGKHFHAAALGSLGVCTSWAVDTDGHGLEWIEIEEVDLHLKRLPAALRGKRVVHISDLHLSKIVTARYLENCVERINELDPDFVVITGDYVTHDSSGKYRDKVADIAGQIRCPHGVYACLGNHDYGAVLKLGSRCDKQADQVVQSLTSKGIHVLRNQSTHLQIDGHSLWLVGLGDLWVGDFKPHHAFEHVPKRETVITLAHNPRAIHKLHKYPVDAVMSGHTHGAQIRWRLSGGLSRKARRFHAGMYQVEDKKLYVNRGLGRIGRARLNAPPEITVLTLR